MSEPRMCLCPPICVEQEQSDAIVNELPNRLGGGYKLLERLRLELIGASAQASSVVRHRFMGSVCFCLNRLEMNHLFLLDQPQTNYGTQVLYSPLRISPRSSPVKRW
jgi:hypothetical protein